MKNQINLENHADNENTRPSRLLSHTRVNPTTGQVDYYFPMEIEDPADKEFARLSGFEIGWTLLRVVIPRGQRGVAIVTL